MTKNRSYKNSAKNVKWPSYIFQILHSCVLLGESAETAVDRIDNLLLDVPSHRFDFKGGQQEKIRRVEETMTHIKTRSLRSRRELSNLIDGIDRSWG